MSRHWSLASGERFLSLCRVSNLPTVWTNVLAAVVLSGSGFPLAPFLLLLLSVSCLYAAGMGLNDLLDREVDRKEKPTRPLPSGKVTVAEAACVVLSLFAAGLALLLLLPHRGALWAAVALVAAILAYDVLHRKRPWTVFLMGGCRLLAFVVCSIGVAGLLQVRALAAGLAQFAYVLALSVVARKEKEPGWPLSVSLVPAMLAGISLVDGAMMAVLASPGWFTAGLVGAAATALGQRWVRGD